ncbi:MAG: hypothetical protein LC753_06720 [Acidobacteria bacterium]|nr:hypothetical protein [Acidobacteriota bacterium]
MPGALRASLAAAVLALAASAMPLAVPREPLRGGDALARVYDFILEARFDQVAAELRRACGPAPPEACNVLDATALWWRILLDPESRALDDEFSASVERAIRTTEEWTTRSPADAESWFYLGGAYAARVQWRVLRNEKLAAARDGKRIKTALERAVTLDPDLDDAYFGIGMYKYYADVAPTAAKLLRYLLLLPGGDRDEGLAEMLRARNKGRLLQGEADYQLHVIYLWYERQTARALEMLRGLQERYPGNPLFLAEIADIQDVYQHDITASLDSWRALLAAAREQRANVASLAEVTARLGVARQLEALQQTDDAIEQLQPAAPPRRVCRFKDGAVSNATSSLKRARRSNDRSHSTRKTPWRGTVWAACCRRATTTPRRCRNSRRRFAPHASARRRFSPPRTSKRRACTNAPAIATTH